MLIICLLYTSPRKAIPALIVSACMNTNPMMIYFGQEFGELGMDSLFLPPNMKKWLVAYVRLHHEQKTAYEIYRCDWSSDVCSSDLPFLEQSVPRVFQNG